MILRGFDLRSALNFDEPPGGGGRGCGDVFVIRTGIAGLGRNEIYWSLRDGIGIRWGYIGWFSWDWNEKLPECMGGGMLLILLAMLWQMKR